MFGFITPNLDRLSEPEQERYKSVYCGLCYALRDNYSNVSRLALSYDLTFLVLLLSSLYEPKEAESNCSCIFHPGKKSKISQNEFSNYAASLTVALAYHKVLDDINDGNKIKAKIGARALKSQYYKVKREMPDVCNLIEKVMAEIAKIENKAKIGEDQDFKLASGDEISKDFGIIMAKIFSYKNDIFSEDLAKFGANLGRFIYFMDAACDIKDDIKNNNYNPYRFYNFEINEENKSELVIQLKSELSVLAGHATHYFEKLPLEQDVNILRNILYEGT